MYKFSLGLDTLKPLAPFADDAVMGMASIIQGKQQQPPPPKPLKLPVGPPINHAKYDNNSTGGGDNLLMNDKTADIGEPFEGNKLFGDLPSTDSGEEAKPDPMEIKDKITPKTPELLGPTPPSKKGNGVTSPETREKQIAMSRAQRKQMREMRAQTDAQKARLDQIRQHKLQQQNAIKAKKYNQMYNRSMKFGPHTSFGPKPLPRRPAFNPGTSPQPSVHQQAISNLKQNPAPYIPSRVQNNMPPVGRGRQALQYIMKHKVPFGVGALAAGSVGTKLVFDMINRREEAQEQEQQPQVGAVGTPAAAAQ